MIQLYQKIFLVKGLCNSYYIDDAVKVLIDAGDDFKKPVDLLILTHLHPDHIFYAKKIVQRTNCKVLIGEGDSDLGKLFSHFSHWLGKDIKEFKIDRILSKKDTINTGEYNLEVLETPGHSLGSISLYEKKHEILFSGDTLFDNNNIGRTDFFHSSEELMDKSLKLLRSLKIKHLFSGHNY